MEKADLHVHTTASDGILSPSEVVDWAIRKGLRAIAITDHDTVLGIEEAINRANHYENFMVVPGIELSSDYIGEEVHILGYFIDAKNKELNVETHKLKKSRIERGQKIVEKLIKIGLNISIEDIKSITDKGFIGRPHIARILVEKGYANDIQDAFNKYIGRDKSAYVKRYKLTVHESIDLIHGAGGVAVLAHPGLISNQYIINEIRNLDIDGIEIVHSKHQNYITNKFEKIAKELSLICTGGSDCHGAITDNTLLLGDYYIDYKVVEYLKNRAKEKYQG